MSGVETVPKLDIESGESSDECLRLQPMVAEAVLVVWTVDAIVF